MTDMPLAWRVDAVDGKRDSVMPDLRVEAVHERFATAREALRRRDELKAAGMVACVTPVWPGTHTRNVRNLKNQISPFGEFAKDWKMTR